jgi:hypothetical protein
MPRSKYILTEIIALEITRFNNYSIAQKIDYLSNFLGNNFTINGSDEIVYNGNIITEDELTTNGVNIMGAFDQTQAASSWTHMFGPLAEPDPEDENSILL